MTGRVEVVAEHGHAEAIADEDHFDARLFLQIGGWIIVAGEPGDRLAFGDFLEQIGQCDFLARFGHWFLQKWMIRFEYRANAPRRAIDEYHGFVLDHFYAEFNQV